MDIATSARTWATCARWRRCCRSWPLSTVSSGCGSPTCSPPSCGRPARGARHDARRRAVLRPVVPARQPDGAAPDAALRRTEAFLELLDRVRALAPKPGARSNVIVGFPGETEDDLAELERFLAAARLDAVGVFGYSDEDGTEAAGFPASSTPDVIAERVERVSALAEELVTPAGRGPGRRPGVEVLVEDVDDDGGRSAGPPTRARRSTAWSASSAPRGVRRGQLVRAFVVDSEGVDLIAEVDGAVHGGAGRGKLGSAPDRAPPLVDDPIGDRPARSRPGTSPTRSPCCGSLLVPVFVVALFADGGHDDGWRIAAWAVFAVASVTDRIDGDLARKRTSSPSSASSPTRSPTRR